MGDEKEGHDDPNHLPWRHVVGIPRTLDPPKGLVERGDGMGELVNRSELPKCKIQEEFTQVKRGIRGGKTASEKQVEGRRYNPGRMSQQV